MKSITFASKVLVYEHREEIPEDIALLIKEAEKAATHAYAKYSNFQVGAAILLNNGQIVTGSNQENAVYPCGLCAERTAAFAASARFPEVPFTRIAVTAINPVQPLENPISPCGSCRQVLFEFEERFGQPIEVILSGQTGPVYIVSSIADLLPYSFHAGFLPK